MRSSPWASLPALVLAACASSGAPPSQPGAADAAMVVDAAAPMPCQGDVQCTDPHRPRCDPASKSCQPCLPGTGDGCAAGSYCAAASGGGFACKPGCKTTADCGKGDGGAQLTCCASQCVDTGADGENCGACGTSCGGGAKRCCGGACLDTAGDPSNCGVCGQACMTANGAPACAGGKCTVGSCSPGFADCNGDASDGCETPTSSDPANCGACKKLCPAMVPFGTAACTNGHCVVTSCQGGHAHCAGDSTNGCETDVVGDPSNCGACGKTCALPNATSSCVKGACAVKSCQTGFGDCDGDPSNGCEAPLSGDPVNCGMCGKVCPAPPNVIAVCANGQCGTAGCKNGFADCNKDPSDGCEANLASDVKSCGSCGNVCMPKMQGDTVTCVLGACVNMDCNCKPDMAMGMGTSGSATVHYTGTSFCDVCGTNNYGCTTNGTLGDKTFQSPVVGLPRTVKVVLQIEGCGQNGDSVIQVSINATPIGTLMLPYHCACGGCGNETVMNFFPNGVPGFNVNGVNTLRVQATSGSACGASATITLST